MELITGLFNFAKQSPFKLVIILAIISALSGTYIWHINQVETAGYNKAKVEIYEQVEKDRAALEEAHRKALSDLQVKLTKSKTELQNNKKKAVELQELLDNRPTVEVIREIPKIETDCTDIGDSFERVFKSIIIKPTNSE